MNFSAEKQNGTIHVYNARENFEPVGTVNLHKAAVQAIKVWITS